MRKALGIAALGVALVLPSGAFAQPAPPSPSPALRSLMERVHTEARTAAYAALTSAHAADVTALAGQVAAGSLDPLTAEQRIDALLTPDEQNAVRAAAKRARRTTLEALAAAGAGPMPPGRGAPPGGRRFGRPSAGRYLLMVSIAPDRMRELMPRARRAAAP